MLENRFALLNKRGHPLLLILRSEQRMEKAALEMHAFGKRRFVCTINRFLDHHHRGQRKLSDGRGRSHCLVKQGRCGNHPGDQSSALCLGSVHEAGGQTEIHRFRL
jgi:hypothetical protein